MDLLCTENITHDYENELQCRLQQQQQQQQHLNTQHINATTTHNACDARICASPSLLSSDSTSSSSTTSSGYNSAASFSSQTSSSSGSITSCSAANCINCQRRRNSGSAASAAALNKQNIAEVEEQQHCATHSSNCNNEDAGGASNAVGGHHCNVANVVQSDYNNAYINNQLNRTLDHVNTATEDPTFLSDRCLENALKAEEKRPQTICTYFMTVQKDITPPMRKIVAEWMMEVCAEEKCQEEVVLLALNYMDRFLSTKSVRKTHLQILAAACLLLASKLREPSCRALSAELLVFYTDNSIYKNDLIKWELLVLSRLGWDLSSVTPLDFLELLLIRLPITSTKYPDLNVDKVRQHAQAFISLAAKEHYFSIYSASTIAASSIAASLNGLNWHLRTGQNMRHLLNLLTDLTSIEQDYLHDCMMKMEKIFQEHSRKLQPYYVTVEAQQQSQNQQHQQQHQQSLQQQQQHHHQHQQHQQQQQHQLLHHAHNEHDMAAVAAAAAASVLLPDLTQTCKMQANAQKDVQDIKF